jgi:hypothetical protein
VSAHEDDADLLVDELDRLIEAGEITDLEALDYLSGQPRARAKLDAIFARVYAERLGAAAIHRPETPE